MSVRASSSSFSPPPFVGPSQGPGRNSSRSRTSGANINNNTPSNIPSQRCQLRVELLEGNGFKHDGSHQVEVRVDGHAPVRSQWASSDDDALASMDSFGNVLLGAGKRFPGPPLFFRNISANMLYLTLIHKRTFTDHKRCGEAFLKLPEPDGIAKTLSLSLDHKMRFAGNLKVRLTYAVVEGGGAGGASSSSTTSGAAAAASRGPASAATSSGRASMSRAEALLWTKLMNMKPAQLETQRAIQEALLQEGGDLQAQAAMMNQFEQMKSSRSPSSSSPNSNNRSPASPGSVYSRASGLGSARQSPESSPSPSGASPRPGSEARAGNYRQFNFSSSSTTSPNPPATAPPPKSYISQHSTTHSNYSSPPPQRAQPRTGMMGSGGASGPAAGATTSSTSRGAKGSSSSSAAANNNKPSASSSSGTSSSTGAPAGANATSSSKPDGKAARQDESANGTKKDPPNHRSQSSKKRSAASGTTSSKSKAQAAPPLDPEEAKRQKELAEKREEIKKKARESQLAKIKALSDTSAPPSPAPKSASSASPTPTRRVVVERVRSPDNAASSGPKAGAVGSVAEENKTAEENSASAAPPPASRPSAKSGAEGVSAATASAKNGAATTSATGSRAATPSAAFVGASREKEKTGKPAETFVHREEGRSSPPPVQKQESGATKEASPSPPAHSPRPSEQQEVDPFDFPIPPAPSGGGAGGGATRVPPQHIPVRSPVRPKSFYYVQTHSQQAEPDVPVSDHVSSRRAPAHQPASSFHPSSVRGEGFGVAPTAGVFQPTESLIGKSSAKGERLKKYVIGRSGGGTEFHTSSSSSSFSNLGGYNDDEQSRASVNAAYSKFVPRPEPVPKTSTTASTAFGTEQEQRPDLPREAARSAPAAHRIIRPEGGAAFVSTDGHQLHEGRNAEAQQPELRGGWPTRTAPSGRWTRPPADQVPPSLQRKENRVDMEPRELFLHRNVVDPWNASVSETEDEEEMLEVRAGGAAEPRPGGGRGDHNHSDDGAVDGSFFLDSNIAPEDHHVDDVACATTASGVPLLASSSSADVLEVDGSRSFHLGDLYKRQKVKKKHNPFSPPSSDAEEQRNLNAKSRVLTRPARGTFQEEIRRMGQRQSPSCGADNEESGRSETPWGAQLVVGAPTGTSPQRTYGDIVLETRRAMAEENQRRFSTLLRSVTVDQGNAPGVDIAAVLRKHKEAQQAVAAVPVGAFRSTESSHSETDVDAGEVRVGWACRHGAGEKAGAATFNTGDRDVAPGANSPTVAAAEANARNEMRAQEVSKSALEEFSDLLEFASS